MPRVVLLASAHLHNVALLQPEGGSDDEEMNYFFRVNDFFLFWIAVEWNRGEKGKMRDYYIQLEVLSSAVQNTNNQETGKIMIDNNFYPPRSNDRKLPLPT